MNRILIVAPNFDLRRSLQFAMEAEGYLVTAQSSTATRQVPGDFVCTVVDHHALDGDKAKAVAFCQLFSPVILLANTLADPLTAHVFRTILKPTLGPALTAAIRDAVEAHAMKSRSS